MTELQGTAACLSVFRTAMERITSWIDANSENWERFGLERTVRREDVLLLMIDVGDEQSNALFDHRVYERELLLYPGLLARFHAFWDLFVPHLQDRILMAELFLIHELRHIKQGVSSDTYFIDAPSSQDLFSGLDYSADAFALLIAYDIDRPEAGLDKTLLIKLLAAQLMGGRVFADAEEAVSHELRGPRLRRQLTWAVQYARALAFPPEATLADFRMPDRIELQLFPALNGQGLTADLCDRTSVARADVVPILQLHMTFQEERFVHSWSVSRETNALTALLFDGDLNAARDTFRSFFGLHPILVGRTLPAAPKDRTVRIRSRLSKPQLAAPVVLPGRRSSGPFEGRIADMHRIRTLLETTDVAIVSVEGLAGIGKTELALRLANEWADEGRYPGGIFWFDAESSDLSERWAGSIAAELNITGGALEARVAAVLRHVEDSKQPTLLVLDNVEEWGEKGPKPLPRQKPHIRMLVTTRRKQLGREELVHHVLGFMSPDESRNLLLKIATGIDTKPGFEQLVTELGGYTLATRLAASYLALGDTTPEEYLKMLHAGMDPELTLNAESRPVYDMTVRQALNVIWSRMTPSEQEAWRVAAQFDAEEVPFALLNECVKEPQRRSLVRMFLIEPRGSGWSMHRLVQRYGREKAREDAKSVVAYVEGCASWAGAHASAIEVGQHREYRSHLDRVVELCIESQSAPWFVDRFEQLGQFLSNMAMIRLYAGESTESLLLMRKVIQMGAVILASHHPIGIKHRMNLAEILLHQRDPASLFEANELMEGLSNRPVPRSDDEKWRQASQISLHASIQLELGELDAARDGFARALELEQSVSNGESWRLGRRHQNLAIALRELATKQDEERESLLMAARDHLLVVIALPPSERDGTLKARAVVDLGSVLRLLGHVDECRTLLAQACEILRAFPSLDFDVARWRSNLANELLELGASEDLRIAEEEMKGAIEIDVQLSGRQHPRVVRRLNGLAKIYWRRRKKAAAIRTITEAWNIVRGVPGADKERRTTQEMMQEFDVNGSTLHNRTRQARGS